MNTKQFFFIFIVAGTSVELFFSIFLCSFTGVHLIRARIQILVYTLNYSDRKGAAAEQFFYFYNEISVIFILILFMVGSPFTVGMDSRVYLTFLFCVVVFTDLKRALKRSFWFPTDIFRILVYCFI